MMQMLSYCMAGEKPTWAIMKKALTFLLKELQFIPLMQDYTGTGGIAISLSGVSIKP